MTKRKGDKGAGGGPPPGQPKAPAAGRTGRDDAEQKRNPLLLDRAVADREAHEKVILSQVEAAFRAAAEHFGTKAARELFRAYSKGKAGQGRPKKRGLTDNDRFLLEEYSKRSAGLGPREKKKLPGQIADDVSSALRRTGRGAVEKAAIEKQLRKLLRQFDPEQAFWRQRAGEDRKAGVVPSLLAEADCVGEI